MNLSKLKEKLIFLPLGGSGEIGMNLNLYHYQGKWIAIDCGTGFAEERIMPGVDIVVPDVSFIVENDIKIEAIIITHAHEDHIGAVPHLWDYFKCPIYATPFAAHFLKNKLTEFDLANDVKIKVVTQNRANFSIGPFNIEMIGLTHSIPEMRAIYINTPAGKILHTGDWKLDHNPVLGDTSDEERLKQLGDLGIDAMVCDSTNVFSEGWSGSEGDVEDGLYELVQGAKQLAIITTFASNVARLQTIANVAKKCGRKIMISGTSLHRITAIAKKIGYLDDVDFIDAKFFSDMDRSKILIIATGCQGEPLATVAKLSGGTHPLLKLKKGDRVIFSSKIIPGNEKKIAATLNRLADLGIEVFNEKQAKIHVSGHPNKDELKHLYDLVRPKTAIPVHGEAIHINEHCKWAAKCGVPETISVRNGDVILFENGSVKKIDKVHNDYLGIDGNLFHAPGDEVMRLRRKLKNGIIICNLVFDKKGHLLVDPQIIPLGSIDPSHELEFLQDTARRLQKNIQDKSASIFGTKNKNKIEPEMVNLARSTIKQLLKHELQIEPLIQVVMSIC